MNTFPDTSSDRSSDIILNTSLETFSELQLKNTDSYPFSDSLHLFGFLSILQCQ